MRALLVFLFLQKLAILSRLFFRHRHEWIDQPMPDPWPDFHVVAILNHTSLYEFLFAGAVPSRFLWRMAQHGTLPVAAKTIARPFIGHFWRLIARTVIPISRERDRTWSNVLTAIEPDSMVVLFPEGKMKRANGLDRDGNPMQVRGGVADIIASIPEGRILLAFSQGLHHIQIPGQRLPRLFRTVALRLQALDIVAYRQQLGYLPDRPDEFKRAVVRDLTERRDRYCPSGVGEK